MWKAVSLTSLLFLLAPFVRADGPCPITLVSGADHYGDIVVSFRNAGKLPVQQIELNSACLRGPINNSGRPPLDQSPLHEEFGLFFPGTEYELKYARAGCAAGGVLVTVRSVRLSDGLIWKPTRNQTCRPLRIPAG